MHLFMKKVCHFVKKEYNEMKFLKGVVERLEDRTY